MRLNNSYAYLEDWHTRFAYAPVYVGKEEKRFWEWVERRARYCPAEGWSWEYRAIDRRGISGDRPCASTTTNMAFEEYRKETLRRLEEEKRDFLEYLENLRLAKDKAEFDEFMSNKREK